MSKQINSNDKTTRLVQLLGRVTLFVGLIVAACLLLDAKPTETELRSGDERSAKRLVSLHSDPDSPKPTGIVGVGTRPIEQIKVGDRVMARNPEVSDAERASWTEPDWNQWLHLSLVMPKEDGSELKIELLRPESWLLDQVSYVIDERTEREPRTGATSGKALPTADKDPSSETHLVTNPSSNQTSLAPLSPRAGRGGGGQGLAAQPAVADIPLSPLRPFYREVIITTAALHASEVELVGLTVVLDLPEMGATGTAVVTNVTACPMVRSGAGQPITATFSHPPSTAVLNVVFSGESQPIGVTDNHLFWSVDRQQFLPIGKMEIGEQVQTFHGETKRIEAKLPRPGPQVVYNLEVYGEHVYFVGSTGMLAHNRCTPLKGGGVRGHGALQDLRAPRTVDDLLVNGKVPDRTNGAFHRWFDELSTDDFNTLWADSSIQSTIRQRLLFKGGHHEWLVRARANVFKSWGLSVKDIANTRQLTNRVNFANNPRGGAPGGHVGFPSQSKVWHNELIGLVDQASDFSHFKRLLNDFADLRLDGGRRALPRQLRLD